MKRVALISLVAGYLVLWPMLMHMAQAQSSATMGFNLSSGESVDLDSSRRFDISVMVNTGGEDSGAFESTITFDSSELTYVDNGKSIYTQQYAGDLGFWADISTGQVTIGKVADLSPGSPYSPLNTTSSVTVANLEFEVASGVNSATLDWVYVHGSSTEYTNVLTPDPDGPGNPTELLGSKPPAVTLNFNAFVPAPDITGLNPDEGTEDGGTSVTITGTNFGSTQGTGSVTFGGTDATVSSWGSTSISVTTPAHSPGDVYARVFTNDGQSTSASDAQAQYTYTTVTVPTPDITDVDPSSGSTGGGTSVTISGTNFGSANGQVQFGGTSATIGTWSDTSITVTSPARTAGTIYVDITTNGGQSVTNDPQAQFTYIVPGSTDPVINDIEPSQGTEDGGTSVTLSGSNFGTTEGDVYIDGNAVSINAVTWGSAGIVFTTPAHPITGNDTVEVYVVTSDNETSNSVNYTYIDEDTDDGDGNMTISYLSPSSGRADQTVVVTIYGSGFSDSQGSVRFGQWDATIVSWTDGQIRVNAPVLGSISSDVTYPVMVTQGSDSASSYYTYLAPGSTGGSGATNGTGTTPDTGLPTVAWLGLITVNGGLAFVAKRKLFA